MRFAQLVFFLLAIPAARADLEITSTEAFDALVAGRSAAVVAKNWLADFTALDGNLPATVAHHVYVNGDACDYLAEARDADVADPCASNYERKAWVKSDAAGRVLETGMSFLPIPKALAARITPAVFDGGRVEQIRIIFVDRATRATDVRRTATIANW